MNKQQRPEFPLSGGDYIDDGKGLKRVGESTAPPVPKSQRRTERSSTPRADNGDPDTNVSARADRKLVDDTPVKST